jgi:hypothetical protein
MKVFLDECVDWGLSRAFKGRDVKTARQRGGITMNTTSIYPIESKPLRRLGADCHLPTRGTPSDVETV